MRQLLPIVENSSDCVLYAMDETGIRTESDIRRTWSPIGVSPLLESNNSHKGLNIVGATELSKNFDSIIDAYSAEQTITATEIEAFLKRLLSLNSGKKVYVLLDNARFHICKSIQAFASFHSENLVLINTPRYSPELNPQENIWNRLKNYIFSTSAYPSIEELFDSIKNVYTQINENNYIIKSIVHARSYYS